MLGAIVVAFAALAPSAPPELVMFGATWCGPCKAVRAYFEQNRVPYTYRDIDDEQNRAAFRAEGGGGIPLVIAGASKVRGANLPALAKLAGLEKQAAPAKPGGESYGGHSPTWWQEQFQDLRTRIDRARTEARDLEAAAADHHEKEVLARMKENLKILEASLDVLENEASNAGVPRKYRG